jgi:hypothetical protein
VSDGHRNTHSHTPLLIVAGLTSLTSRPSRPVTVLMVRSKKSKYSPQAGDLVFAKVRGHRFWPARVSICLFTRFTHNSDRMLLLPAPAAFRWSQNVPLAKKRRPESFRSFSSGHTSRKSVPVSCPT